MSRDYGYRSLYVIKFITWSDSRITLKKYIEMKKKMSQFNTFHTFRNLTYTHAVLSNSTSASSQIIVPVSVICTMTLVEISPRHISHCCLVPAISSHGVHAVV